MDPANERLNEDLPLIEEVCKVFLEKLGIHSPITIEPHKKGYLVNWQLERGDDSLFIGRSGKTLEALNFIINLLLKRKKHTLAINLDIAGYLERRRRFIVNKAIAIAKRVKETQQEMRFDPVSLEELAMVREALKREKGIRTYTVNSGEEQILVIAPT